MRHNAPWNSPRRAALVWWSNYRLSLVMLRRIAERTTWLINSNPLRAKRVRGAELFPISRPATLRAGGHGLCAVVAGL